MTARMRAVLDEHIARRSGYLDGGCRCDCGWTGAWDEHNAHLSNSLLSVVALAQAEALREWISGWPTAPHDGTFLADVAADGLARADRIERGVA